MLKWSLDPTIWLVRGYLSRPDSSSEHNVRGMPTDACRGNTGEVVTAALLISEMLTVGV